MQSSLSPLAQARQCPGLRHRFPPRAWSLIAAESLDTRPCFLICKTGRCGEPAAHKPEGKCFICEACSKDRFPSPCPELHLMGAPWHTHGSQTPGSVDGTQASWGPGVLGEEAMQEACKNRPEAQSQVCLCERLSS